VGAGGGGLLQAVGEGQMPNVMQEGCYAQSRAHTRQKFGRQGQVFLQAKPEAGNQKHGAQAVRVACMGGPGEGQLPKTQLPNVPQALKQGVVHQGRLVGLHLNGAINRVAYSHR